MIKISIYAIILGGLSNLYAKDLTITDFKAGCRNQSKTRQKELFDIYKRLINTSKKRDIDNKATVFTRTINRSCNNQTFKGFLNSDLDIHKSKGRESEVTFMANEIKRVANFREPTDIKEKLVAAANKANVNWRRYIDQEKVDQMMEKGKRSFNRSRRKCSRMPGTLPRGRGVSRGAMLREATKKIGPVRDQDSVGWCFAFTAADLLTHNLKEYLDGPISALDVATQNYKYGILQGFDKPKKDQTGHSGGFIRRAALDSYAQRSGFCLEKDLPIDAVANDFNRWGQILKTIEKINDLKNNFDRLKGNLHNPGGLNNYTTFVQGISCPAISSPWRKVFLNLTGDDIIQVLGESELNNVWQKLVDKNCEGKRVKISPRQKLLKFKDKWLGGGE